MAFILDTMSNQIRDELPQIVHDYLPKISPVYNYIHNTSISVERDKGMGDKWYVNHLYGGSLAGLIQTANPMGPTVTTNTKYPYNKMLSGTTNHAIFPNALESPHTAIIKRTIQLHMSTGNFNIPVTWMTSDKLNATQVQQIAMDIQAVGKLRALTEAQSFFMASNNTLGQVGTLTLSDSNKQAAVTLKAGSGRIQFFRRGMMLDVFDDDGSGGPDWIDQNNSDKRLIVNDVDYVNQVVYICSTDYADISNEIAADDFLVIENTGCAQEMRSFGLNDWMADSGVILRSYSGADYTADTNTGLDLDTYRDFKSLVVNVGGPLTEDIMNRYFGSYFEAYPGNNIDTILTTTGVTLNYLKQPGIAENRFIFDRTGKALDYMSGWEEVGYKYNGKLMKWMTSPMVLSNTLYGLNLSKGNIKRYSPPRIGGADGRIGSEVEFLAPLTGLSGIFMGVRNGDGQAVNILEAPFWQYMLIAPIDPRGIKLTGLTEVDLTPPT